jgi:DNA repair and recombination RAD54-like protein
MRESMCELVYSKDALTESMVGKLKQAFKLPVQDPSKVQMFNPDLRRKSLGFSKKPGTWTPVPYSAPALMAPSLGDGMQAEDEYTYEELVLWTPPPVDAPADTVVGEAGTSAVGAADVDGAEISGAAASAPPASAAPAPAATAISVDGFLCRWLREHQREGVQFLFDCCMGMRDYDGEGCILADDMGLGEC